MLRSTFREPAGSICWQRQLRDRYSAEGVPPVPHLDPGRAVVRGVSRATASRVVLKYEWLGAMAPTYLHFGIFFGPYCAGVACVGNNTATAGFNQHCKFGVASDRLLTLARGACVHWAPPGTNSKLVAWACRLLARSRAGSLIVAYADSDAGEIGTIYQACNWTYIGPSERPGEAEIVSPKGVVRNSKSISDWARERGTTFSAMRNRLLDAGWRWQASNPKHRYVYVLDRNDVALVSRVAGLARPYPKRPSRAGSADSGTSATHAEGAGATPSPALP